MSSETIKIELIDKTFEFKCPTDQVALLREATLQLNQKMLKFRQQGQTLGFDQTLMMAAIETSVEQLGHSKKPESQTTVQKQVAKLRAELQHVIIQYQKTTA